MNLFKKKKKESVKNNESNDEELLSQNLDESITHLTVQVIKVLKNRMKGEHNGKVDCSYYNTGTDLIRISKPYDFSSTWEISLFEEKRNITIIPLHTGKVKTIFSFHLYKPITRISGEKTECYLLYKTVQEYIDYLRIINIKKMSSLLNDL